MQRVQIALVALQVGVLCACGTNAKPSPTERPASASASAATTAPLSARTTPSSAPSSAGATAAPSAVTSAVAVAGTSAEPNNTTLFISKSQLLVGADGAVVVKLPKSQQKGFAPEHKRSGADDLYIVPLANRLKAERAKTAGKGSSKGPGEANVIADRNTSYRILVEVLYTLGQNDFSKYHLLEMKQAANKRTVNAPKPRAAIASQPAGPASSKPLHLSVLINSAGFTLKGAGKSFAPDCIHFGERVTIPKSATAYTALSRCAARIKKRNPTETDIVIAADNDTPYAVIIDAIDTLRSAADGTMFPDLRFGIPR